MATLFLGLTVYFTSNKEIKEERKKQWLVNILLRFSMIEENRSLCVTSSFFIPRKLKSLRQTNARIQVFIGSVSYRWFDWGSLLMKGKSVEGCWALYLSFFFFCGYLITYIFESSITGGAYLRDFHLIWLKVQEEHVYEITFHIKPNTMTERLKRKNNLCKKGRMKMYEIW